VTSQYLCSSEGRRAAVRAARDAAGNAVVNGIDFLEIAEAGARVLQVHFIHPLPGQPGAVPPTPAPLLTAANLLVEGGVRVRNVRVESVEPDGNVLTVKVSAEGDFSTYTLHLVTSHSDGRTPDGFDPALSRIDFSFKAACPVDFDCATRTTPVPDAAIEPATNYLAKDYQTFRQLMLDRLSVVMPDWRERTPADMEIALVELMAYVADSLSYYQDAVATEAYLGTARQRISVRRHARLLDYFIDEGSNARTWISVSPAKDSDADGATLPSGTRLLTGAGRSPGAVDRNGVPGAFEPDAPVVFETVQDLTIHADRNLIRFHTWSDQECWLPAGATQATVVDRSAQSPRSKPVDVGDVLLFEEILSPTTGLARDADPAKRCAVRLTSAVAAVDPLTKTPVVEIAWGDDDALPFSLCLSARVTDGAGGQTLIEPTVARGNIALADHGATIRDEPLIPAIVPNAADYRPTLASSPLTFQARVSSASAASALEQDAHDARPVIFLNGDGGVWSPQPDLFASDPFSRHFVVEMQSDGVAHLRFGDGVSGRKPSPGASFTATYRKGMGTQGNVGADAIARIVAAGNGISDIRNPLAATGGRDPETLEQVRQFAPRAFRTQERAVTEADYAGIAERRAEIQKAAATFRWTGSWFTAFVTVDRRAGALVDAPFKTTLTDYLQPFRIAGYDLEVAGPIFVPLDIAFAVCAKPGYFQNDVKQALLDVFSSRDLPGGARGFFHPDNFTFGQSLYLSQMYQAALQVPGVASLDVTRFQRWTRGAGHELERGVVAAAPLEILQLSNDPSFPENGRLSVTVAGGL
jgi:hypothetical protein